MNERLMEQAEAAANEQAAEQVHGKEQLIRHVEATMNGLLEQLASLGTRILSIDCDDTMGYRRIRVHVEDAATVLHNIPGALTISAFNCAITSAFKSEVTRRMGAVQIFALSKLEPGLLERTATGGQA